MIAQQTIGIGLRNRFDIFEIQVHEMGVISFLDENILVVVAAIVDI